MQDILGIPSIRLEAVFIPKGKRYVEYLERISALMKGFSILVHQVAKDKLSAAMLDINPDTILSLGWPLLFKEDMIDQAWDIYNVHPSLLPKYRGESVFYHIIVAKEPESGVTFHKVSDSCADNGPILHQVKFAVHEFDTWRSLRNKSERARRQAVTEGLRMLVTGNFLLQPQPPGSFQTFPRRCPADSEFDPSRSMTDLYDHIRGCDPHDFPAFFCFGGERIAIKMWRMEKNSGDLDEL